MTCRSCQDEIQRWRETSPLTHGGRAGGLRIASGAAFDDTAAGVAANRTGRWETWRNLVQAQTRLIREQCAAQHVDTT